MICAEVSSVKLFASRAFGHRTRQPEQKRCACRRLRMASGRSGSRSIITAHVPISVMCARRCALAVETDSRYSRERIQDIQETDSRYSRMAHASANRHRRQPEKVAYLECSIRAANQANDTKSKYNVDRTTITHTHTC